MKYFRTMQVVDVWNMIIVTMLWIAEVNQPSGRIKGSVNDLTKDDQ